MEPVFASDSGGLGCSKDLHKTVSTESDAISKVVRPRQVSVQARGVELSQDIYLADTAVDAIAHRNVNKTVSTLRFDERKLAKIVLEF